MLVSEMGEGACYAKNIYYRQICLFLNDLLHRNDSFSQTYSHVEAGIPLPGFRRDFFRVPASLCFVLGVSHGYKPTSRACKFRFILSLSTLRCHLWEDESRLRLDFFYFYFFCHLCPRSERRHLLRQFRRTGATFSCVWSLVSRKLLFPPHYFLKLI